MVHLVEHFKLKELRSKKDKENIFFSKSNRWPKKENNLVFFQIRGVIMICKFSCKDDSYYRACARTPLRIRARPFVRKNCPGQSYLLSTETFPAIFLNNFSKQNLQCGTHNSSSQIFGPKFTLKLAKFGKNSWFDELHT